jgi:hypothetical protein
MNPILWVWGVQKNFNVPVRDQCGTSRTRGERQSLFAEIYDGRILKCDSKPESALHNENVLLGFESGEAGGQKVGVRLIAGVIARRIVPFVEQGEEVLRGRAHQPHSIRFTRGCIPADERDRLRLSSADKSRWRGETIFGYLGGSVTTRIKWRPRLPILENSPIETKLRFIFCRIF